MSMKHRSLLLCTLLLFAAICLSACVQAPGYVPTGEFYMKTPPSRGDTGVEDVISMEADHITYQGKGDITVAMTVGLGHLPGALGYGDEVQDTFYVVYKVIEAPWQADRQAVWEEKVEYSDSWYDSKYDSTEQKNPPSLIFARYGEFYPLYKESVELVFPASVEKGYLQIEVYAVIEGREDYQLTGTRFYFERVDGVLTLHPEN